MINKLNPLNSELNSVLTEMNTTVCWYEQDQLYFITIAGSQRATSLINIVKIYYPNATVVAPDASSTQKQITLCIGSMFDFIQHPADDQRSLGHLFGILLADQLTKEMNLEFTRLLKAKYP